MLVLKPLGVMEVVLGSSGWVWVLPVLKVLLVLKPLGVVASSQMRVLLVQKARRPWDQAR